MQCNSEPVSPAKDEAFTGEWKSVYEEHSRPIYYFVLRMLRDPETAEDVTHDVFLKAFKNSHQFKGESSIRTWLYRIALNHTRNVMKSWHHRNIYYDPDIEFEMDTRNPTSPLTVLNEKELGNRIQNTLDQLPEEYRVLLLMVADEKLSYEEVGKLTRQSADAVRGKLYRARKAFSQLFTNE